MKLWVDDIREPPDDSWVWSKTSEDAIRRITVWSYEGITWDRFEVMSLDHDLGGDDTTRTIVLWLCETGHYWPDEVLVHTANPVGREWLEGMIERYKR